jgi:hypothetical protein
MSVGGTVRPITFAFEHAREQPEGDDVLASVACEMTRLACPFDAGIRSDAHLRGSIGS